MSPESVSLQSVNGSPAVTSRTRFATLRTGACVATVLFLSGLAASFLYCRQVTRRMNQWRAAATKAGLNARIETRCLVKWLDSYPICRRCFPTFDPEVTVASDDEILTLFGIEPQCPVRLRIHCLSGSVRFVVVALAQKALDVEVEVFADEYDPHIPSAEPRAPFTAALKPFREE